MHLRKRDILWALLRVLRYSQSLAAEVVFKGSDDFENVKVVCNMKISRSPIETDLDKSRS